MLADAMKPTNKDLLKFAVIGNVDDGKSTLIGRLLFDTKSILDDQLAAIEAASKRRGASQLDLSLMTDGLKAEREQGITIDVAHKYFATEKRKFVVADCPGHIQYTKNMVTGTSNSQAALLLIDARNGITEQTKRHALICSMMKIQTLIVCINKMDLVSYSENVFNEIRSSVLEFSQMLSVKNFYFVPISALRGENVVSNSRQMSWYGGQSLLSTLEEVPTESNQDQELLRIFVQKVIRGNDKNWKDFRGYAGRIDSGKIVKGQEVIVYPSGLRSKVKSVYWKEKEVLQGKSKMNIVFSLEDDFDISRGSLVVNDVNPPHEKQDFLATLCWFSDSSLSLDERYYLRQSSNEVAVTISSVHYKFDIETLTPKTNHETIKMNDLILVQLNSSSPIFFDSYERNHSSGSFILVDPRTNNTVAAGIVRIP